MTTPVSTLTLAVQTVVLSKELLLSLRKLRLQTYRDKREYEGSLPFFTPGSKMRSLVVQRIDDSNVFISALDEFFPPSQTVALDDSEGIKE